MAYYRHVTKAEKTGDREVTFTFDGAGQSRTAADHRPTRRPAEGVVGKAPTRTARSATSPRPRSSRRWAAAPTASRISLPGRDITYERVKDYWGKDLNVNVGINNFDQTAIHLFPRHRRRARSLQGRHRRLAQRRTSPRTGRRPTISRRSPTSGSSKKNFRSATPASCRLSSSISAATKFQDPRVRLAFNYALDFEELNKQLFFGSYKRIASYFAGTDLAATGLPTGRELELLETVRDKVPPEVFKKPYTEPGQRHARTGARQSARSHTALESGRLRAARSAIGQCQDRRALYGRAAVRRSQASSGSIWPTSPRSIVSA